MTTPTETERPVHLAKTVSPLLVSKCGLTFSTSAMFRWTGGPKGVTCPACLKAMADPRVISGLDTAAATPDVELSEEFLREFANAGDDDAPPPSARPSRVEVGHAWRVGRKLGRTLYRDGECVGIVDTRELAEQIVAALGTVPAPVSAPPLPRGGELTEGARTYAVVESSPPAKPAAVAVGQRWRYAGIGEYEVTSAPREDGAWETYWPNESRKVWFLAPSILADEYLGTAPAPPAEPCGLCGVPMEPCGHCPVCGPHAQFNNGNPRLLTCHHDANEDAAPPAPAPGVGEVPRELTPLEAFEAAAAGKELEYQVPGSNGWLPSNELRPGRAIGIARLVELCRNRYRLRPEPPPAPAPRLSRVREMVDAHIGDPDTAFMDRDVDMRRFAERVVEAMCKWLSETEAGHMIDHDLPDRARAAMLEPR